MTIRHLLTHSHGLVVKEKMLTREFAPGTNWAYRGAGIPVLAAIVKQATGKTIADILHSEVFKPLSFLETAGMARSTPNWLTSCVTPMTEVGLRARLLTGLR